jgi:large subunit ribosomal protein L32
MAVPKKKISKQKRNSRRAHDALRKVNISSDSKTGEYKLSHHMSLKDGFYNGKQIIVTRKPAETSQDEEQSI